MLKQIHIKSLRSTFLTLWKELNNKRQVIIPKRYRKILKLPPSANAFNMTEAGEMHLASRTGPLTRNEVSQKSSARKPTITGGHRLTTTSFFFLSKTISSSRLMQLFLQTCSAQVLTHTLTECLQELLIITKRIGFC